MVKRTRDAVADLNLPPGFRFHPTDEELVLNYLCPKTTNSPTPVPIIAEVHLYKYDPWQLPEMALFGGKEWYFLTPRDRKYPNGSRPNRATVNGYWKATGADKPVTPEGRSTPVGIKKALVFYTGKAPVGVKTNWIMHEYRLVGTGNNSNRCKSNGKNGSLRLDDWVLCRLYNKKKNWENELRQQQPSMNQRRQSDNESFGESFEAVEETLSEIEIETQSQLHLDGKIKEDYDWFMNDINFDYINHSSETAASAAAAATAYNGSAVSSLGILPDFAFGN